MAKRRNKSTQPNLPQSTLERARQQAQEGSAPAPKPAEPAAPPVSAAPPPASAPEKPAPKPAAAANPYVTVSARERRARTGLRSDESGTLRRARRDRKLGDIVRKDEPLDAETVAYLLHNPTKEVSEDELRSDYNYVIADIRSMGVLAVGLVVALIALALVFVR